MLESIKISKQATFQGGDQVIDNLSKFNFIFGSNGSGKTTISRIIADADTYPSCAVNWKAGIKLQPLVYNRDFVERNFNQSSELKGVFTLGEGNAGILDKITAAKTELDDLTKKIGNLKLQLKSSDEKTGKLVDLAALEEKLKNTCWEQKKKHDVKLQGALEGYRNSAEKFKAKILQELSSNSVALLALEDLEKKAATVFGEAPTSEQFVPSVDVATLEVHESTPVLKKRVIGKTDVDIAAMIKKLGNSDWVRTGRSFFEANDSVCPFCQQSTDAAFAQSLNEYFDEAFETDSKAIDDVLTNYRTDSERLQQQLSAIIATPSKFIDLEMLKTEKELLDSRIIINLQRLAEKKKEPSQIIELESIANVTAAIKELIGNANAKVLEHNNLVENIANERKTLTAQVWKYLLEELKTDLSEYTKSQEELNKSIASINAAIEKSELDEKLKTSEIQELEKQITSIQPTLDGINCKTLHLS